MSYQGTTVAVMKSGWQPAIDSSERALIDTTFVVIDLETTGGSPFEAAITEIGAVKVRGGELIGEFQTLVNPGGPIPPFITVLTGITDAMVIAAPNIGEAFLSLLEFIGSPEESVLVAHNSPFDIGFLKAAARKLEVPWPAFKVVDTARISRYALTRDEVPNFKLASLAQFFGATTTPEHRALADARATVDVLHGVLERLGSLGVSTLEDLRSYTNRVTDSQRRKRYLGDGLPNKPGVYIFRDERGAPLYIGTTRDLRSRVRSYFTAAETRKRIHDMIALATRLEVIETNTILEAEVLELRLIASEQPRFNRRSRRQEKAIWVRLSEDSYPRLIQVRGATKVLDGIGWCGPFNGREEAARAIEAIQEVFPIRQCTPRITIKSMASASPCALLGLRKCGAPCVGLQSLDSYLSIASEISFALLENPRRIIEHISDRMNQLALAERFEEAAGLRDRLGAFVNGAARGQRIRSLTRVEELVTCKPNGSLWELTLIRSGRLCATRMVSEAQIEDAVGDMNATSEVVDLNNSILPASSHEEVERILKYLQDPELRILAITGEWFSPINGAGLARAVLEGSRSAADGATYKELFANSFDKSRQR